MKKAVFMGCTVLCLGSILIPLSARADADDDKKFLATAAQSDQNEMALSKIAAEKATNPAVKAYAKKMLPNTPR